MRNLIAAGHIAPGVVDERDIRDIKPSELRSFTQCHFFAGIGVWSYGLRLAGWSDDRPIWTGSCPCQPFSASGKRSGFDDERHLWPSWQHLIHECGPAIIAGEQVASKDGYAWLDLVQSDLEGMDYACGAVVSPSAGYGAPHERHRQFFGAQRLDDATGARHVRSFDRSEGKARDETRLCVPGARSGIEWLAVSKSVSGGTGFRDHGSSWGGFTVARDGGTVQPLADTYIPGFGIGGRIGFAGAGEARSQYVDGGSISVVGVAHDARLQEQQRERGIPREASGAFSGQAAERTSASTSSVADSSRGQLSQPIGRPEGGNGVATVDAGSEGTGPTNGFWRDADWIFCRDERWRAIEPGSFPLAHGATARVGRLRGYGNAINAYQTKAFIEAFAESITGA
nr:DNA cytosine methyltransferase [Rhizobium leguminosarum]